jgi:hypothetical protein
MYDQLCACCFVSKSQRCSSNGLEMAAFKSQGVIMEILPLPEISFHFYWVLFQNSLSLETAN